jgi:hypothetical protein
VGTYIPSMCAIRIAVHDLHLDKNYEYQICSIRFLFIKMGLAWFLYEALTREILL